MEGELECCQSSNVCSGSNTRLGYSQCCADGSGSFRINNTSYACSGMPYTYLLTFYVYYNICNLLSDARGMSVVSAY